MNDTAWKTFARSGPWTLLAVLLIGYYFYKLDPKLDALQQEHVSMRAEFAESRAEEAAESRALLAIMEQIRKYAESTAYLQRVQCQNEADNPDELRRCAKDHE